MTTFEISHPNIPLAQWENLKRQPSALIRSVVDRTASVLPDWLQPLARGVAIASDRLLRMADDGSGSYTPDGWNGEKENTFKKQLPRRRYSYCAEVW